MTGMYGFKREKVFRMISAERERQEKLKKEGKFAYSAADVVDEFRKLSILTEEVGEVGRVLNDHYDACDKLDSSDDLSRRDYSRDECEKQLRDELTQVAAVAVAWLESLV